MKKFEHAVYFGSEVDIRNAELSFSEDTFFARSGFPVQFSNRLFAQEARESSEVVDQAVATLLQFSGCVVNFVDTSRRVHPYREQYYEYPRDKYMLGFNDHRGGSESHYKILLNQAPDGDEASYVLYSPPLEDGEPSNMTFRRCDFTFLSREPIAQRHTKDLRFGPYVPNPLKTHHTRGYWDRSYYHTNYDYYLFGLPETKQAFFDRFASIGFEFSKQPYELGYSRGEEASDTVSSLDNTENEANRKLGYTGSKYWPGDQFAPQLAELKLPAYVHPEYQGRSSN
jgi:hypothetical protein